MLNRRGPIAKLVGGAVGLTKEWEADRKERKQAAQPSSSSTPSRDDGGSSSADQQLVGEDDLSDDEEWVHGLDEVQQYEAAHEGSSQQQQQDGDDPNSIDIDRLLREFIARHPVPSEQYHGALPLSVILPQRRPESRNRGFVKAYAPVLENCGINQTTWFEFIDGFEKSIKANPWFHVANGAIWIAGHVEQAVVGISPLVGFITMAMHVSMEASRRAYVQYKQNQYLDTMNEQFFKPRGLYCLVMTYKPSSDDLIEDVDIDHNITKSIGTREGQGKWKRAFSTSSSTTTQEAQIPECAPLIFPQLDSLDEKKKGNSIKQFGSFLSDYYDRQAAAKFEAGHPESKIPAAPRKEFASDYSDPTTKVGSGGLITMASGGKYNPVGPLGKLRERVSERRAERGTNRSGIMEARKRRKENRPLRRMLKQNALYLMVVNLPSQEEMDRVLKEVNA
ncbi:hypothetical protein G7054_g6887 [Neopestalotiopsis clavispora]|nr:hypothetical protein G7054_g6887 [Neopestalotiopsis clavispora]